MKLASHLKFLIVVMRFILVIFLMTIVFGCLFKRGDQVRMNGSFDGTSQLYSFEINLEISPKKYTFL